MPYPSASVDLEFPVNEAQVPEPSSAEVRQRSASQGEPTSTHAYNPFVTLAPTSWWPILRGDRDELRLGLETSGTDVLGYHGYTISGTWLTTAPSGFALPASAKPEWQISYQYSRWRPTLWFSASSETSFFAGPANESGVPSRTTARERVFEGGVVFRFNTSALPKRPCFRSRAAWMNSGPRVEHCCAIARHCAAGGLSTRRRYTAIRSARKTALRWESQPSLRRKRSDRQPTPQRRRSTGGSTCRLSHRVMCWPSALPEAGRLETRRFAAPFIWVASIQPQHN